MQKVWNCCSRILYNFVCADLYNAFDALEISTGLHFLYKITKVNPKKLDCVRSAVTVCFDNNSACASNVLAGVRDVVHLVLDVVKSTRHVC